MTLEYVSYFDDALDRSFCENLIQKFEKDKESHVLTNYPNLRNFTEINLANAGWVDAQEVLLDKMEIYLQKYRDLFNIDSKLWPNQVGYEAFRMKRYMPNNLDDFKFHVDVGDYASAKRFLVYFWYLNDVDEGGETAFYQANANNEILKVQPKTGRLLMFPPMWTHPHAGLKPISGPKYIVGGYLHYV